MGRILRKQMQIGQEDMGTDGFAFQYEEIAESLWRTMGWVLWRKHNAVTDTLKSVNRWRSKKWRQSKEPSVWVAQSWKRLGQNCHRLGGSRRLDDPHQWPTLSGTDVEKEERQPYLEDWWQRETHLLGTQQRIWLFGQHGGWKTEKNYHPQMQYFWNMEGGVSAKDTGEDGCGVVIYGVDSDRWVTIRKIVVPLKVGTAVAAEVRGVCVLTEILEPMFNNCLRIQKFHRCIEKVLDEQWFGNFRMAYVRVREWMWNVERENVVEKNVSNDRRWVRSAFEQMCSVIIVFKKSQEFLRVAPRLCFLRQCKITGTIWQRPLPGHGALLDACARIDPGAAQQLWSSRHKHILLVASWGHGRYTDDCACSMKLNGLKGQFYVLTRRTWIFMEDRLVRRKPYIHIRLHSKNPCSPTLWQWWVKLKDGKKKKWWSSRFAACM